MRIALYGKNYENLEKILQAKGVKVVDRDSPHIDLMICYGGDGAMLNAELLYPGLLKMPVRDVETAPHCPRHSLERQIDLLLAGALSTKKLPKLSGTFGSRTRYAVNDIFIHNVNNYTALRYQVKIDGELYAREVVGDGVGVSTVHGSTAYYRSITHGSFRVGIGVAFSNSTELMNHLVLEETSVIQVRVLRGPAELVFDNSQETEPLSEGDIVTVRQSDRSALMLGLDLFMCPECRRIRREQRATGFDNIPF